MFLIKLTESLQNIYELTFPLNTFFSCCFRYRSSYCFFLLCSRGSDLSHQGTTLL